jgi:hypothetical protein
MTFTFTAVVKATAAKFNFAACSRHAKCSFRVRLHTKNIREVLVEGQAKKKLETTADAVVTSMDILGDRLTGMASEYDSDQQQYAGITT